jgi:hypothetical protein
LNGGAFCFILMVYDCVVVLFFSLTSRTAAPCGCGPKILVESFILEMSKADLRRRCHSPTIARRRNRDGALPCRGTSRPAQFKRIAIARRWRTVFHSNRCRNSVSSRSRAVVVVYGVAGLSRNINNGGGGGDSPRR